VAGTPLLRLGGPTHIRPAVSAEMTWRNAAARFGNLVFAAAVDVGQHASELAVTVGRGQPK
jgi:hypothetical protein